jgi:hypothetical protein
MATVEVFVDDAVRGRLPRVCAKTGLPSDGKLRIEQATGGLGLAWLLIFLGPVGWIVLLVCSWSGSSSGVLTVRLPYSDAAVDHEWRLRRIRFRAAALGLLGFGLALAMHTEPSTAVVAVVAAGATLVSLLAHLRLLTVRVGAHLDASQRWVTLTHVHPDFVRAVERSEAAEMTTGG